MFGKDEAKRQRKLAEQQQAQATQYMQQAAQPSPLELARQKELADWTTQTTGPGFDITKAAAMNPYLQLYNNAVAERDESQNFAGQGLFRLGQNGANPTAVAMMDRLNGERRRERAGGALENAFRVKDAQIRGDVMPLLGLQTQRGLTLSGQASGNANNAWARAMEASQNSGFFNSAFYKAMQESARSAAMAAGG
jgi:hypothetical protein